jgi:hypothetical protein
MFVSMYAAAPVCLAVKRIFKLQFIDYADGAEMLADSDGMSLRKFESGSVVHITASKRLNGSSSYDTNAVLHSSDDDSSAGSQLFVDMPASWPGHCFTRQLGPGALMHDSLLIMLQCSSCTAHEQTCSCVDCLLVVAVLQLLW